MSELISLCGLGVDASARVAEVAGERAMRRRLMDMGLIPGTRVTCVAASPAGDPSAYLIRGRWWPFGDGTPQVSGWSLQTHFVRSLRGRSPGGPDRGLHRRGGGGPWPEHRKTPAG